MHTTTMTLTVPTMPTMPTISSNALYTRAIALSM